MRYHRGNREQEMCSRHTGATLWSAANIKTPALFNNQMHHLSPRAKNQQLSSDWFRCKCCSHKRWKMTLVSHFLPPPPRALLCKLSGVFVTAWCWRKQQQAELWIANVPWGGRPRFDILNKLQIRQAGRGSGALLISLPHHSQICPCENGKCVSLDTFVAHVLLVMEDWTIQHSGKALSTRAMLAQGGCQMGKKIMQLDAIPLQDLPALGFKR